MSAPAGVAAHTTPDFVWPLRVYWEDTDAGGIVFYANYLKFFERARSEWLRSLGVTQERLRQAGQGMFVVSETQVKYRKSARLDDALRIETRLQRKGRATLTFVQTALRVSADDTQRDSLQAANHKATNVTSVAASVSTEVLSTGLIEVAWLGARAGAPLGELKPSRIPPEIWSLLP
jgi:acyl-CoA thioester hydrolase